MEPTTPKEAKEPAPRQDLRGELFQDLSMEFIGALNSNASIPDAAQLALVELLAFDAPTAAEIIAAASKNDPVETGVGHE